MISRIRAKCVAAVAVACLVGCATPNDLRQGTPDLEISSQKPAKLVAMCIADKWEHGSILGTVPVSMRETPSGYMVMILCGGNNCVLADILNGTDDRSKTKVYLRAFGAGGYLSDARECQ